MRGAGCLFFGLSSCGLMKSSPAAASDPRQTLRSAADAEHRSGIVLANGTAVDKSNETPAVELAE